MLCCTRVGIVGGQPQRTVIGRESLLIALKAMEPRQRALDHPAMPSQPLARLDVPAGNTREDAPLAAGGATAWVAIPFVGVQLVWAARPAAFTMRLAQQWDGVKRGFQHP